MCEIFGISLKVYVEDYDKQFNPIHSKNSDFYFKDSFRGLSIGIFMRINLLLRFRIKFSFIDIE